jgi:hypothetical protein
MSNDSRTESIQHTMGDVVTVIIGGDSTGKVAHGLVSDSDGWRAEVVSRTERPWCSGEVVTGWIAEARPDDKLCSVYIGRFGRMTISDRMRPRYLAAVSDALTCGELHNIRDESRAELQGMFNRIIRRDQWDWFDVAEALGTPSRTKCRNVVTYLSALRESRKTGCDVCTLPDIDTDDLLDRLRQARDVLTNVPRTLSKSRKARSRAEDKGALPLHETERSIISSYSLIKLRTAIAQHNETLEILRATLTQQLIACEDNQAVDLFARLKSGPAIFEVKSIHAGNEQGQARAALSQLYEYRFLEHVSSASLWVLFSQEPRLEWLIDYFEQDRDVRVLWIEDGRICGPSADRLFESGIRAKIRKDGTPDRTGDRSERATSD